ncbi:MAG: CPXCG motif-containing cysteine-rich protein [Thiotrichales bacterium]|nr:CPXCG motif-containing cysteine-rich protein [Thiotrichales bacterium]
MNSLNEKTIQCPWCWEHITVLVDPSVTAAEYVEDCQVCCRPILLSIQFSEDRIEIIALRENE